MKRNMFLKVKNINIATGGPLIAILNCKDANKLNLQEGDRILLKKGKKEIIAPINITDLSHPKEGQIGLYSELSTVLKTTNGQKLKIKPTHIPKSIELIRKKLDGTILTKKEIKIIVKDLIENDLTEIELTYFVAGCYNKDLTKKETEYFTKAAIKHGTKLKLNKKLIVDKHSPGGVPNNRTTMLITPILAAAGLTIAKTSSRAITSPSGTVDTMEVLAKVKFSVKEIKNIVKKTKGCIVWGSGTELAGGDEKLIHVRHPLKLDPEGLMIASILSKKASVGSTHILLDFPIGKTAKIKSVKEAKKLKKKFVDLGKKLGMKIKGIITDGSEPIGNGIGPALEARDILYILRRDNKAPKDLEEKAISMANKIFKMTKTKKDAKKILESGLAYKKMKEIIKAQRGKASIKPEEISIGKYNYSVKSSRTGKVKEIDNKKITRIARTAGAPSYKEAGIYLYKHKKSKVKRGEKLFTIYSNSRDKLNRAKLISKQVIRIK